ncbi:MAG TPA: hemolysin family protein [Terriglobales bacterium]|nr:hemolysin family protein [Terriglobales bacterium]
MAAYVLLRVLAVLLLIAVNAFFVAAEFALISVRDTRIQQLIEARRIGARTVQRLHSRMEDMLSAVQLGVTLAALGLGWVGEPTLAAIFLPAFHKLPHGAVYAHALAIAIAFVVITYLDVVLGEVVPKALALQRTERVALAVATPMDVFMRITRPFLQVVTRSARLVLRLFGMQQVRAAGIHSPEELKMIVTASRRYGMVEPFQEQLMVRALELENITVREIMVPRHAIFSLASEMPLEAALSRVVEEQHSRIPVYDAQRGPEHIIGLLYSKDLTRWMRTRYTRPAGDPLLLRLSAMKVRDIMREVLVVPESKPIPDLLLEFKRRKRHLAVVVDEFGSTSGVVTVEDVLEQIVGEIEDEFDVAPQAFAPGATSMELDAFVNIRDLETQYHLILPRDRGFETLAGFVLYELQRMPKIGDSFEFEGRRFTVLAMDAARITRVKIERAEGGQAVKKTG